MTISLVAWRGSPPGHPEPPLAGQISPNMITERLGGMIKSGLFASVNSIIINPCKEGARGN
jgi:hypothetical protein